MISAVGTAIGDVLAWVQTVITALVSDTGELHALLPLFAIGVAISAIMLGIKIVMGFIWGA